MDVREIRQATGLTQRAFAERYRLKLGILQAWESGRRNPSEGAENYLTLIKRAPDKVAALIA